MILSHRGGNAFQRQILKAKANCATGKFGSKSFAPRFGGKSVTEIIDSHILKVAKAQPAKTYDVLSRMAVGNGPHAETVITPVPQPGG